MVYLMQAWKNMGTKKLQDISEWEDILENKWKGWKTLSLSKNIEGKYMYL